MRAALGWALNRSVRHTNRSGDRSPPDRDRSGPRLVLGEYRALEAALWQEIARLQGGQPLAPVVVAAPSGLVVRHLKWAAARAFPAGLGGVQFANLFQLALDLAGEAAGRFVPEAIVHEHLLLGWLATGGQDEAILAGAAPGTYDLAGALHAAVRDLRDAAVPPEPGLLLEALRAAARLPGSRLTALDVQKLGALLAAHRAHAAALAHLGLADRAAVFAAAAARADRLRAPVVLYGFYDLTQVQADLVTALGRHTALTLLVPHGDDPATWRFADWFRDTFAPTLTTGAPLRLPPGPPPPVPVLASAVGDRDEVWLCAKRIRGLLDGGGCAADEIAVVARSLEPYLAAVHEIFAEHHIPVVAPAPRALSEHPLAQAVLRLCRATLDGLPRAALLDVVLHPAFRASGERRHWALLARALRIARGRDWDRLERVARHGHTVGIGREDAETRREIHVSAREGRAFRAAVARVRRLAWPEAAGWGAHAEAHRRAIGRAFREDGLVGEEARVLAALLAVLDTLADLDRVGDVVPRRTFVEAFARECQRRRLEMPAGRGVQVLDAMAARGLAFRHVFVLGLNARVFPRFIVEEPFVSDAVRREVIRVLGHHLPVRVDAYDEERLLFHLVCASAGESLVLVHQRADAEGRLRDPSPFLRPLLGTAPVDAVPRSERAKLARNEVRTPREMVLAAEEPETALRALGHDALAFRRAREVLQVLDGTCTVSAHEGHVGPLPGLPGRLSATRLEEYATCPFRYFAGQVLRVLPYDDPARADDLAPRDIGILLHAALETLYRGRPGRPDAGGTLEAAVVQAVAAAAQAHERRTVIPFTGLAAARVAQVRRAVAAYAAWDLAQAGDWQPVAFEVNGAARLGGHALGGRIDRIDRQRASGRLRVIDYKRRWRQDWGTGLATQAARGRKLQAPVYLELAAGLGLGEPETALFPFIESFAQEAPGGGAPGARFAVELSAAAWQDCRPEVEAAIETFGRLLAEGWFFVRPDDGRRGGHCTWCDFRSVCRKAHGRLRWKPEETALLAPYFGIVGPP